MNTNASFTRRKFVGQSLQIAAALASTTVVPNSFGAAAKRRRISPNEKLNIGVIGVTHRGAVNLKAVSGENIVALCDVDSTALSGAAQQYPKAKTFIDWRKMIDQDEIDALVVSTTDHTHALISVQAMRAGKHVYCEKPIGVSVQEARLLRQTALETKVATQTGTVVHASANFLKVAKMIREGAIGPVREAHVWCTREGLGTNRPTGTFPVPTELNWDLWLGPAPVRPYNPAYFPGCGKWNKYWDFGCGVLGDMGSHLIDFPFAALDLRLPTIIEAEGPPPHLETYPKWMRVRWDHPATATRPAVQVFWYDGNVQHPNVPKHVNPNDWHGVLYIGDKSMIWVNYGGYAILPVDDLATFKAPLPNVPSSTSVQGHYDEWILGCKTGSPTACNFDYAGTLIEHNMLGIVSYRTGQRIQWDAQTMQAVGCPEADQFIRRNYRPGWAL